VAAKPRPRTWVSSLMLWAHYWRPAREERRLHLLPLLLAQQVRGKKGTRRMSFGRFAPYAIFSNQDFSANRLPLLICVASLSWGGQRTLFSRSLSSRLHLPP